MEPPAPRDSCSTLLPRRARAAGANSGRCHPVGQAREHVKHGTCFPDFFCDGPGRGSPAHLPEPATPPAPLVRRGTGRMRHCVSGTCCMGPAPRRWLEHARSLVREPSQTARAASAKRRCNWRGERRAGLQDGRPNHPASAWPPTRRDDRVHGAPHFVINEAFAVPGVGTVVAGTLKSGRIHAGSNLVLGPDIADGRFKPCTVKSIHFKRLPVPEARPLGLLLSLVSGDARVS